MVNACKPIFRGVGLILLAALLVSSAAAALVPVARNESDIRQKVLERVQKELGDKRIFPIPVTATVTVPPTPAPPPTTIPTPLPTKTPTPTRTREPTPAITVPTTPTLPAPAPVDPLLLLRDQLLGSIFSGTLILVGLILVGSALCGSLVYHDLNRPAADRFRRLRLPMTLFHALLALVFLAAALTFVQDMVLRSVISGTGLPWALLGGFLLVYLSVSSAGLGYGVFTGRSFSLAGNVHLGMAVAGFLVFLAAVVLDTTSFPPPALLIFPATGFLAAFQYRPRKASIVPIPGPAAFTDTMLFEDRDVPLQSPPFPPELRTRYYDPKFISQGGIARVYSARRRGDGARVAVKIPIQADEQTGKSLLREMSVWQGLDHPSIVRVTAANILPVPYVEMEYLPGSLEGQKTPLDPANAARLMASVARGLSFAHSRGVIHRDLKPANILLTAGGEPRIADWGLSRDEGVMDGNTLVGFSLAYAAPEQLDPERFGRTTMQTDIYQLGVIFYRLLTGRLPFPGESLAEVTRGILSGDILPPSSHSPQAAPLDGIVLRCLARDPKDRYRSMGDLEKDLEVYLEAVNGRMPRGGDEPGDA